ncbi:hypothetical protein HFO32_22065 [Rhizobium leguminosarum]|uniref:hypothetical protein n=1 Tax=Rhizobium leguminosarum TaxID=384 RepID=UPI001C9766F5|nr:hypothetical protein [Rhizobium leguminosarum]MBY5684811.1 hypothetical protein [Rhizobium leguminosarum]
MFGFSYLKIGAALAIIVAVGLAYWHYTSILSDREELRVQVSTLTDQRDQAIQTANDNAQAAKELEATYKTQIAALEVLATETAVNEALSRAFTDDIATADDIEIPDALAKPFLRRFGGKP